MKKSTTLQAGFTFIEIIVVIGILSLLFSIGYLSIANFRSSTTSNASVSVIISDLKAQQIKAMTGDTEGRGSPDVYGVKILPNSYVLFHGNNYNPSDTTNFSIPSPSGHSLSSTFANTSLIFASKSGELVGFTASQNTVTLTNNSTGQTKTILINKFGTITDVN